MISEEQVREILSNLKFSFLSEEFKERIQSIQSDKENLVITYSREGISPQQKREIEEIIHKNLEKHWTSDQILVKTISSEKDLPKSEAKDSKPQKSASLNVGHGNAIAKREVEGVKTVLAVSSCKGGVGKSTVAVNLAFTLRRLGFRVGLLDADIYGPSIPTLLKAQDAQPKSSKKKGKKIEPLEAYGMKFISFGLFIPQGEPTIWRGPMLNGVLNQFLFDVNWPDLDYLLIDLPPGTGDVQLSLIQNTHLHGAIVVSTPQEVALVDAQKGLNMFVKMKVPVLGLIENMSYFVPDKEDKKYYLFGKDGVKEIAKKLKTPFLGELPFDIPLRETSDKGVPYMNEQKYEGGSIWNAYMGIAKKIAHSKESGAVKNFLNSFLKRKD